MNEPPDARSGGKNLALSLAGAVGGGVAGIFLVGWLVSQDFYGVALPGVIVGAVAGWLARGSSRVLPVLCGLIGLSLCLVAEWRWFPFIKDPSFTYFLAHVGDLKPVTWIMILLGGFGGFYFSWRGSGRARPAA
jgi:hypothetical protein